MDLESTLKNIVAAADETNKKVQGDYIKDGLLYCGKCNTPKQIELPHPITGVMKKLPIICECKKQEMEKEEQLRRERNEKQRIAMLRINGIQDRELRICTFENSDDTPEIAKAKKYVDKWDEMLTDNIGLLMWGNTGNGKTYAAAAIANALIDKGIPVLVTSFPKIIAAVTGLFADERAAYLESLANFKLLVIDDLGAERQSEFALEIVYSVIDDRYKNKLPLIVTTNIPVTELRTNTDMTYQRVYDRVLEMCVPIHFKGESIRKTKATEKRQRAIELFSD